MAEPTDCQLPVPGTVSLGPCPVLCHQLSPCTRVLPSCAAHTVVGGTPVARGPRWRPCPGCPSAASAAAAAHEACLRLPALSQPSRGLSLGTGLHAPVPVPAHCTGGGVGAAQPACVLPPGTGWVPLSASARTPVAFPCRPALHTPVSVSAPPPSRPLLGPCRFPCGMWDCLPRPRGLWAPALHRAPAAGSSDLTGLPSPPLGQPASPGPLRPGHGGLAPGEGVSPLQASPRLLARPQVPKIVSVLRSKLQETRGEHVLQAAQHSVYVLAARHHAAVVSSLLGSPLPFDRYVVPTSLRGWTGLQPPELHVPGSLPPWCGVHGPQPLCVGAWRPRPRTGWRQAHSHGLCWPVLRAGSLEGVHHHL